MASVKILVTGSAGHLGEGLMRTLAHSAHEAVGLDLKTSPFTQRIGSITDRAFVHGCMRGVEAVLHAATLHKPHIATHSRQEFVDTNITGTLNLLEEAVLAGVRSFVYTSTTSTFGRALAPPAGAPPAWITEDVACQPKNIYGATKLAAENLCDLFHQRSGLACIVLRTARFFPEEDDDQSQRRRFDPDNLKVNEFLHRRADIDDVVGAHVLAMQRAPAIGFDRFIVSATTPFQPQDLETLSDDVAAAVRRYVPFEDEYARRGWSLGPINRVYVNEYARTRLGWQPHYDFASVLQRLRASRDYRSELARAIGCRGYHARTFDEGPYPIE